jgi:hypothetical protein
VGQPITGRRLVNFIPTHRSEQVSVRHDRLVCRLALRGLLLLAIAELLALALRGTEILVSGGPAG